ncbi:hypothetical protein LC612_40665, partial [Nostoc sp. CHAB 5834]|nr:hypothetical protein [Nostoc sp. CHAB 5834]
ELSAATAIDALPSTHADIKLANLASDFMNYRLLFNFYNFRNSVNADLWDIFEKEIFPHWTYDSGDNISFEQQLADIRQRLYDLSQITERNADTNRINHTGAKQQGYKTLLTDLTEFYQRFAEKFRGLEPDINTLLNTYFLPNEDVNVLIQPQGSLSVRPKNKYELDLPVLRLTLTVNGHNVVRPQTFLNEARLTALALSIRLAMVGQRFKGVEGRDDLRILVLDDLLISLDMSNRMKVIKYLQTNEDFKKYQLIILTHDKGFFEVLKTTLSKTWKWFELFDNGDSSSGRNPICIESEDALARAKFFLEDNTHRDYDVCALYLRRKAEELLRLLYDPSVEELTRFHQQKTLYKSLEGVKTELNGQANWRLQRVLNARHLSDAQINFAFDGGIDPSQLPATQRIEAGKAIALQKELKKMLKTHYKNRESLQRAKEELVAICEKVNEIRGRILNSGAHYNHEPLFETELRAAFDQLLQLKDKTFRYISDSD